ncbi:hypothetical protein [Amycolatopsis sp. NPDC051372]
MAARILHDAFDGGARGGLPAIDPTNEQLARTLGFRTVDTWTTADA